MGTLFNRDHEPPEEATPGDAAYALVQATVSLIPGAADLLQMIIAPPLARRQREWMEDVAAAIRQLEAHQGVSPEDLRGNDSFVDAFLAAWPAAVKTSQQEKRAALRNAVVNAALPGAPDLAQQQTFISLIDRWTEWHLRLLKLFQNPKAWRGPGGRQVREDGSLSGVIEQAYPELRGRGDFYTQVWADLHASGLHGTPGLHTMMTGPGTMATRTSDLGDTFLAFIESPLSDESSARP
jgi:hypothetical protein